MKASALKLAAPTAPPANAQCILYVRVSTDDQAREDKTSLADQERQCRDLAARLGYPEAHVWSDAGRSGRDPGRLQAVVTWCETHRRQPDRPGLIVYFHPSRWARFADPADAIFYQQQCKHAGWDWNCVTQPRTGNKGMDLAVGGMGHGAATADNEEKIRRVRMGMEAQAALGRWLGRAPFGYVRVALHGDRKRSLQPFQQAAEDEHVVLALGDADTVRTVRLIFQRAREGATCKAIAKELHAAKVPGPFDVYRRTTVPHTRKWRACTVRAILKNPVYGGTYIWNRRKAADTPKGKRPIRPEAEWKRLDGAVPALVDRAAFKAVQEEFKRRKGTRSVRSTDYLLTGLATCGRCGAPLVGGGGHAPNRFYKCAAADSDKTARPPCEGPRRMTVNQVLLETTVVRRVGERVAHLVKSGALAKTLDGLLNARPAERQARAALDKERRELESKRDRLEDVVLDGTLSKDRGKVKLAEIEAGLARVERELTELRLEPKRADLCKERDRLLRLATDFPARLRVASTVAARDLVAQWLAGIVVHPAARKGGNLDVEFTWHQLPAVGSQLAVDTPAHRAAAKRCWRAACQRSSPR